MALPYGDFFELTKRDLAKRCWQKDAKARPTAPQIHDIIKLLLTESALPREIVSQPQPSPAVDDSTVMPPPKVLLKTPSASVGPSARVVADDSGKTIFRAQAIHPHKAHPWTTGLSYAQGEILEIEQHYGDSWLAKKAEREARV
ncbi:hypothetical protein FB45DRAFT_1034991 [Roridomyces roridus]|uniref:Uncharacterized protein n=1 Tax=Roridomyces roridus TaxID=1738132 RepID=A0AAD7FD37_9AGAR|nr:hypothetical protein FB45DRAFT_1034991 [Roridomyces roridus]